MQEYTYTENLYDNDKYYNYNRKIERTKSKPSLVLSEGSLGILYLLLQQIQTTWTQIPPSNFKLHKLFLNA